MFGRKSKAEADVERFLKQEEKDRAEYLAKQAEELKKRQKQINEDAELYNWR